MGAIASRITSLMIVYSYSDADQRKHQSSASLAVVWGTPVNSPHKWPVTRKKVSIWWRHHGGKCFYALTSLCGDIQNTCLQHIYVENTIAYHTVTYLVEQTYSIETNQYHIGHTKHKIRRMVKEGSLEFFGDFKICLGYWDACKISKRYGNQWLFWKLLLTISNAARDENFVKMTIPSSL